MVKRLGAFVMEDALTMTKVSIIKFHQTFYFFLIFFFYGVIFIFWFLWFLEPKDFSNDLVAATFCKIRKTTCIFPFTYKDEVHNSCIQKGDTFWCATDVNEQNEVIDGFWGKCDVDEGKTSCDPNWKPKPEQQTNIKSKGKYWKPVMRNSRIR